MENWKKIEGYNGRYEVSDKGNVRSIDMFIGTHVYKGKVLCPHKKKNGYLEIGLTYKGKRKFELIHRIVAKAFISNPDRLPCVNHKDEMKTNNYKILLKALGFAMLAVIGIVVLSLGWGLLSRVVIPVAVLTALIYHMLRTISRNKEEE